MKGAVQWLVRLWMRDGDAKRARQVAAAYQDRLHPEDPTARLVLADLAHYCHVGETSFSPGEPHATAFHEGRRDVFLHVAALLGLTPDDFPALLNEVNRG